MSKIVCPFCRQKFLVKQNNIEICVEVDGRWLVTPRQYPRIYKHVFIFCPLCKKRIGLDKLTEKDGESIVSSFLVPVLA